MKTGSLQVTEIERAIVVQLARGYQAKEIAASLGMSTQSVSQAKRCVFTRNGITNDTQLGMMVERCQLVGFEERNRIEDRREERMDAQRAGAQ